MRIANFIWKLKNFCQVSYFFSPHKVIYLFIYYFPNIFSVRKVLSSEKNSALRFWRLYTFWGLRNSFMLFSRWCMHVCVYVRMCMCMCVNTIASKRCIRLRSNWICMLQVAVGRILLILVKIGCIVFFTGIQERILIHYDQIL